MIVLPSKIHNLYFRKENLKRPVVGGGMAKNKFEIVSLF